MEKTRCSGCMRIKKKAVCEHCGYDEKEKNDTHQLQIGTLLNEQYTVGRVLSQSGSDIQYLAWDNTLNSPVVIKEFFLGDIAKRGKLQEVGVKKEKYDVYLTLEKEHHY